MEDKLVEKMKTFTMILVFAICLFGILNTLCLLSRIQKLEEKIETLKPR